MKVYANIEELTVNQKEEFRVRAIVGEMDLVFRVRSHGAAIDLRNGLLDAISVTVHHEER